MNKISALRHLHKRVTSAKEVLLNVAPEKLSAISEVIQNAENLDVLISSEIKANTSLFYVNQNPVDLNVVASDIDELEDLTDLIGRCNAHFQKQKIEENKRVALEKISRFLESYRALVEVYGYVLMSDKEHLVLGQAMHGNLIVLPEKDLDRHIVMVGKSGAGKTQCLISLITQQLILGSSFILLDPFGSLSRELGSFIFAYSQLRNTFLDLRIQLQKFKQTFTRDMDSDTAHVVFNSEEFEKLGILEEIINQNIEDVLPALNCKLVDISSSSPNNHLCINPFSPCKNFTVEETVNTLMDAIAREMGEDPNTTAQASNVLKSLFTIACVNNATLNDILLILNNLRKYAGSGRNKTPIPVEIINVLSSCEEPIAHAAKDYLTQQLLSFSPSDFNSQVNSSRNRISKLLDSSLVHRLLNCTQTTLDIEAIINDESERKTSVIINICAEESGSSFIGHYLFRIIQKALFKRNDLQKKTLKTSIWADEFHRFLGNSEYACEEVSTLFPSIRQHGGCLGVCYQQVSQTTDKVHAAITENANCKIVFQSEGATSIWACKTLWNDLGNLVEWSFSFNNGSASAIGQSRSNSNSTSFSASKGESKTFTEGKSTALGHTVSESFNEVVTQNTSYSETKSEGTGNTDSSGRSVKYHPRGMEEVGHSRSSVFSANHTKTRGYGSTNTSGNSKGQTKGNSNSETKTNSSSESSSSSLSGSVSQTTGNTIGAMSTISENESFGTTIRRMSIEEERRFIEQEIRGLNRRECFIYQGGNLVKAMTIDSLTVKMKPLLDKFSINYYQHLGDMQNTELLRTIPPVSVSAPTTKVNFDNDNPSKSGHKITGTDGLF